MSTTTFTASRSVTKFDISLKKSFKSIVSNTDLSFQMNFRSVQIPLVLKNEENDVWFTLAVDLLPLLRSCTQNAFKCLRGIQICANLIVRSIFTSGSVFRPEVFAFDSDDPADLCFKTFPKEMVLSMTQDVRTFAIKWIPEMPSIPHPETTPRLRTRSSRCHHNPHASESNTEPARIKKASNTEFCPFETKNDEPSFLDLCFVNAFNGKYTDMLLWVPQTDEIVFAASSILIAMNGMMIFVTDRQGSLRHQTTKMFHRTHK